MKTWTQWLTMISVVSGEQEKDGQAYYSNCRVIGETHVDSGGQEVVLQFLECRN